MLKFALILAAAAVCCVQARNKYYLYTQENPLVPELLTEHYWFWDTNFSRDNKTIILIHGQGESLRSRFNSLVVDNILRFQKPHNIIVVDWEREASGSYSTASGNVPFVARDLENLLYRLIAYEGIIDSAGSLHLVGFGLGAHIAGIASRWLRFREEDYGIELKVARITGLDPSGSGWGSNSQRLSSSDARYVEVIHTDGSGLLSNGIGDGIGHINFYANGGSNQPGCLTNSCSHNRAYELFAVSMYNDNLIGFPCTSTTQMNLNRCSGTPLKLGGTELFKGGSSSIYRINTRNYPF